MMTSETPFECAVINVSAALKPMSAELESTADAIALLPCIGWMSTSMPAFANNPRSFASDGCAAPHDRDRSYANRVDALRAPRQSKRTGGGAAEEQR